MSTRSREGVITLVAPSFPRWAARVAFEWTLIALLFWTLKSFHHPAAYLPGIFLLGTRQHALAILAHDGIHVCAARKRWLNDWATRWFAAWPVGFAFDGFRRFHFAHHAHLATERDPEVAHKSLCAPEWDLPVTRGRLAYLFVKDLSGFSIRGVLALSSLLKPSHLDKCGLATLAGLAALAGYLTGHLWMLGLWLIAIPTSFWAIFRLRAMAEHSGGRHTHRVAYPWLWEALLLPHQGAYHYEHHRWPSIPCWNLPRARELDPSVPIVPISTLFSRFAEAEPFVYRGFEAEGPKKFPAITDAPALGGA